MDRTINFFGLYTLDMHTYLFLLKGLKRAYEQHVKLQEALCLVRKGLRYRIKLKISCTSLVISLISIHTNYHLY